MKTVIKQCEKRIPLNSKFPMSEEFDAYSPIADKTTGIIQRGANILLNNWVCLVEKLTSQQTSVQEGFLQNILKTR